MVITKAVTLAVGSTFFWLSNMTEIYLPSALGATFAFPTFRSRFPMPPPIPCSTLPINPIQLLRYRISWKSQSHFCHQHEQRSSLSETQNNKFWKNSWSLHSPEGVLRLKKNESVSTQGNNKGAQGTHVWIRIHVNLLLKGDPFWRLELSVQNIFLCSKEICNR